MGEAKKSIDVWKTFNEEVCGSKNVEKRNMKMIQEMKISIYVGKAFSEEANVPETLLTEIFLESWRCKR